MACFGASLRYADAIMRDERSSPSTGSVNGPGSDRLDSWKEIAAFLGRGIRTVQRWEREEGLPVHRLAHEKRGSIYARQEELAAWWEGRRQTLAPVTSDSTGAAAMPRPDRVTRTSALTSWPALSSNARLIAYVSDAGQDGTTPQIWIQQIGGAALRVTNGEHAYSHLSFSPDDTRIVFTVTDDSGPNVYEVATLGGDPRLLQRSANRGAMSPDGRWLVSVARDGAGIRIAARDGAGYRTVAPHLVDVGCVAWCPDSRRVLIHARSDPAHEADWWMVPIDGGAPANTGVVTRFREAGLFTLPTGVAWTDDSIVISAAGPQGVCLYRQRIAPSTWQPAGAPNRLTEGSESAWLPVAAAGRLAFISSRTDANLWSVPLDATSGISQGSLRRLTRGTGILGYLSLTSDHRTLAYFSVRLGQGDVFLRDLADGVERIVREGPAEGKWDPAMSPSGARVAFGTRSPGGERVLRPIFVISLTDGTWEQLAEHCGGRPREWVDERCLVIQRFGRPNSIAVIDTETAVQIDLLSSPDRSVTSSRLSPDRQWMIFEASRPGEPAGVFVCPYRDQWIPESEWALVARSATHRFWSADGRLVYYTPVGTNPLVRSAIRARRFVPQSGPTGEPIAVFASSDMVMPAYLSGTTPIATRDEIILVLGDYRGDVWLMDLTATS
jgi:Tol biopolymer transport system component